MNKTTKRYLLGSMALGFAFCGVAGATALPEVSAETDPYQSFTINETAEIRNESPVGIRFTVNVPESVKTEAGKNATYGTLVIPKAKLTDVNEDGFVDANDLVIGGNLVANIVTEKWYDEDATKYTASIVGSGEDALTDIPASFYDDVFVARGYVTVGTETIYTHNACERSIAYVASAALAAGESDELSQTIVNAVVPSMEWEEDEVQVYELGESVAVGLETDVKGLVVTYSSANEQVAKYVDGKVVPVGVGETVIKANIGSVEASLTVKVGERQFANGVLNDFLSEKDSGSGNWNGYSTPKLVNLADKGLAAPTTTDGYTGSLTKTTAIEWKLNGTGQVSNWINLYNFYENIDDYNPFDVVEIWFYLDAATYKSYTTVHPTPAGAWGTDASSFGGEVFRVWHDWANFHGVQKWTKVSFTVAALKAGMASNAIEYGALGLAFRAGDNATSGSSVYMYSVEIRESNGVVQDFTNTSGFGYGGWAHGATPTVVELSTAGLSAPTAADGYTGSVKKTTAMKYTASSGDGQSSPYLPMPGLFEGISALNDFDYISIWAYFDTTQAYNWTTATLYAAGGVNWSSNESVHRGSAQNYSAGTLTAGKWIELKYSVKMIKASMEEGETYKGFGIYFTPNNALAKGEEIYYYVAELNRFKATENVNFVDTNVFMNTAWGGHGSVEAVDTPVEIGVPEGKKDNGKLVKKTTDATGQAICEITTAWHTALELSSVLDDNDVIRIWVYVDSTSTMSSSYALWIKPNRDWNASATGVVPASRITTGEWCAWDITGAELRQAIAGYTGTATNLSLMFKLDTNDTSAVVFYFHSVEIVKVK